MIELIHTYAKLACQPSVVRRALKYAVVVGTVLIAINHGDAVLRGELETGRVARMALTTLVPYVVSTLSSVGAMIQAQQAEPRSGGARSEGVA